MVNVIGRRLILPPAEVSSGSICSSPSTITTCSTVSLGQSVATSERWSSSGAMMSFSFPSVWYDEELNSTRWCDKAPSKSTNSHATESDNVHTLFHSAESSMHDLPRIPSRTMKLSPRTSKSSDSERKDAIPRMPQRITSSAINKPRSVVIQGIEDIQHLLDGSSRDSVSAMSGSCEGNLPSATIVSRSDSSTSETKHSPQFQQFSDVRTCHSWPDDRGTLEASKSYKSKAPKSRSPQVSTWKKISMSNEREDPIVVEKPTEFDDNGVGTLVSRSPKASNPSDSSPSLWMGKDSQPNAPIIKVAHEKARSKSYIKSRRYPSVDRRSRRNSVCRSLSSIVESDDEYSFSPVTDLRKKPISRLH